MGHRMPQNEQGAIAAIPLFHNCWTVLAAALTFCRSGQCPVRQRPHSDSRWDS